MDATEGGALLEGLFQGTEDVRHPSKKIKTATATQVSIQGDSDPVPDVPVPRERKVSDLTPGGVLDDAVPKLLEHCRADESKAFMPFFPPGRLLHLQAEKSQTSVLPQLLLCGLQ